MENQKGLFHHLTTFPDAGEATNDFWSMSGSFIYRHHVEPRVKLYSPRAESFPIPLKYIDVSRTTHTNLDVKQEKRIDDYWNIDGSRDLSDPWTGFTQITLLEEKPPDGYMWSGGRFLEKILLRQLLRVISQRWYVVQKTQVCTVKHKQPMEAPSAPRPMGQPDAPTCELLGPQCTASFWETMEAPLPQFYSPEAAQSFS